MRNRWQNTALVMLVLLGAGIGVGVFFSRSGLFTGGQPVVINGIAAPPVPTLDATRVTEGKAIYAHYCASCHGANLEGQPEWKTPLADGSYPPPPHRSTGHTWHHPDDLLITITLNGGNPGTNSKMPAFKEQLSREQVVAVLEFIKRAWGREEREYQWWLTAVGANQ